MTLRIRSRILPISSVLIVFLLIGGYAKYRLNIHNVAPKYIGSFLNTMTVRWALEDIRPFFSSGLNKRKSEGLWRERLGCYRRLGVLLSHTQPATSDTGMFGRVLYQTDGRFQNGDATVFIWLGKSWGTMVVDELYVSGAKVSHLGDHSWCLAPTQRRDEADGDN